MALTSTPTDFSPSVVKQTTPAKYIDLNDYLSEINAPDNDPSIVSTFGDQGITGFLKMVGAVTNVGEADEKTWWEETRLHPVQVTTPTATAATATTRVYPAATVNVRLNDIVLMDDGATRAFVSAISATGFTLASFSSTGLPAVSATGAVTHKIVGSTYAQGTDQPTEFFESNINKLTNGFMILKDIYKVTGSQVGNKAWVNINGKPYYYLKSQKDFNKRFENLRETALLLGQKVSGTATANVTNIGGSQGYFSAIEERGIVAPAFDVASGLTKLADLIDEWDVQGAASDEYAAYINRGQFLIFDDMLAYGLASSLTNGLPSQFGTFNNSENTAVTLGFKSFTRGGRTIHMKNWKLLNEETLLKGSDFKGVFVPTGMMVDAKTGNYMPSLEMNYKTEGGESRLMKSWMTGSVLGARTSTSDIAQFNYLSECNLVTRGANQHTLIKG